MLQFPASSHAVLGAHRGLKAMKVDFPHAPPTFTPCPPCCAISIYHLLLFSHLYHPPTHVLTSAMTRIDAEGLVCFEGGSRMQKGNE